MLDRDLLTAGLAPVGIVPDDDLCRRLDVYAHLLVEWNEKMNLTAITDPVGVTVKHFTDSLLAAPHLPEGPLPSSTWAPVPAFPACRWRCTARIAS